MSSAPVRFDFFEKFPSGSENEAMATTNLTSTHLSEFWVTVSFSDHMVQNSLRGVTDQNRWRRTPGGELPGVLLSRTPRSVKNVESSPTGLRSTSVIDSS